MLILNKSYTFTLKNSNNNKKWKGPESFLGKVFRLQKEKENDDFYFVLLENPPDRNTTLWEYIRGLGGYLDISISCHPHSIKLEKNTLYIGDRDFTLTFKK